MAALTELVERWRDEHLNTWQQHLLAVLVAHGYRERRSAVERS